MQYREKDEGALFNFAPPSKEEVEKSKRWEEFCETLPTDFGGGYRKGTVLFLVADSGDMCGHAGSVPGYKSPEPWQVPQVAEWCKKTISFAWESALGDEGWME